jgi:alkanesulfonate monooxygenase SsuD/methylene tetrahydromethanopterin reductase-like flavin-dependent oxidoreductase (luciferase family)
MIADGRPSVDAVRWGVLLPTFDALHTGRTPPLVEGARLAEGLDFDAGWVGDHLHCHAPILESTVALAAAAVVTERLSLGFSVLLLGLRATAHVAKQIQTIDALSHGRLVLGVGVGGEHPEEFEAAGVPVSRRGARLDEALTVLPDLLRGRAVEYVGPSLEVHTGPLMPAMPRLPRLLIGGRREAALRRVARFGDGWLPIWLSPDVLRERRALLREYCAQAGRPEPSMTLLILVRVDEDLARAREQAAMHLNGQYRLPLDVVEKWAALGPPNRVAEQLVQYVDAGVSELILMPLGENHLAQYERLAEVRRIATAARSLVV